MVGARFFFPLKRIKRYSFGGVFSYLFNIGLTAFLVEVLNVGYLPSFAIALLLTTLLNFILNTYFVFEVRERLISRLGVYLIVVIAFYFANILLLHVLVEFANIHYIFGMVISTTVLFLFKFLFYNRFLFPQ